MSRSSVKVASVDTRNADRDKHLRTNDFFDAPKYPDIVFRSTRIDQVDENSFIVNGELTIKDTTREIAVPIEFTGVETDPVRQPACRLRGKPPHRPPRVRRELEPAA